MPSNSPPESQTTSITASSCVDSDTAYQNKAAETAKSLGLEEFLLNFKPKFTFYIGIPSTTLDAIFDFTTNKFLGNAYQDIINEQFKIHQRVCTFNSVRGIDYRSKLVFCTISGECPCGLKFTVKITEKPKRGQTSVGLVQTQGTFKLIQYKGTGRQLRGVKREETKKELLSHKPGKIFSQKLNETSLLRSLHSNYEVKSDRVLQQLRYLAKQSPAVDENMFLDLDLFRNEAKIKESGTVVQGFIQNYGCTQWRIDNCQIKVHMFTESSLRLLLQFYNKSDLILHTDATGGLVSSTHGKRFLYYLALIKTVEGLQFPLGSMVSQTGTAESIAEWYTDMKKAILKIKPSFNKSIASVAVCDFSFAQMHAICQGLNTQLLSDYIKTSYEIIQNRDTLEKSRCVIFLCTSHIIRSFMRLLSKHIPHNLPDTEDDKKRKGKDIRKLAVHGLARFQSCLEFDDFLRTSHVFIETFCVPDLPDEKLEQNYLFLTNHEQDVDVEKYETEISSAENVNIQEEDTTLREKSKFYKIFKLIRQKAEQKGGTVLNCFYAPIVADLIEQYYIAYVSLFSAMMLQATGRSTVSRLTNSTIESEFQYIKNNFHDEGRVKLNIFVRKNYEYYTARLLRVLSETAKNKRKAKLFKTPPTGKKPLKRLGRKSTENENKPEQWQRRSNKKGPSFVGPIKSLPPKQKQNLQQKQAQRSKTLKSELENIVEKAYFKHTTEGKYNPNTNTTPLDSSPTTDSDQDELRDLKADIRQQNTPRKTGPAKLLSDEKQKSNKDVGGISKPSSLATGKPDPGTFIIIRWSIILET